MENEELARYFVNIKSIKKTHHGYMGYSQRQKFEKEKAAVLEPNFIKVINKVVELGGVVCLTKRDLSATSIYKESIIIKLSPSKASALRSLAEAESVDERK